VGSDSRHAKTQHMAVTRISFGVGAINLIIYR
jgi:hypothetical protein